jgi:mannan endo-1,4-beta-mannosidase
VGCRFTTPYEYKDLFRYTIEYLREEKGIHHFLYAYSPNGPFADEADYLERYPGDDYIDIIGFDMYHDRPTAEDGWMDVLVRTARQVCGIARDRHKAAAVTEAGIRMLDTAADGHMYEGLSPTGNTRPDWFGECLDALMNDPLASGVAYFLVWANFSPAQFWVPYAIDGMRGHEMINSFTEFLNDPRVILARELPDM